MMHPSISALGDSGITITLGEGISEELSSLVVAHAGAISRARIPGVADVVPSYASIAVFYDPMTTGYADMREHLLAALSSGPSAVTAESVGNVHTIRVHYDGPDLEEVAQRTGLSIEEVIRIHTEAEYRVFVTGFVPGFAYLGVLDHRLALPRRESPRKRVPAGSVAIAEHQTGIYPAHTPGGWHLIGATDEVMFDPRRDQPALLRVGDTVRFERVT